MEAEIGRALDELHGNGPIHCPKCGGDDLSAVNDGDDVNFFCARCGSCWHVCLNWVVRVDCGHCPGCGRPSCAAPMPANPLLT